MASTGQFARCVLRFSKSACIQIRIITISFFKRFRILRVKQCLDGVRLQPNHIYINISSIFSPLLQRNERKKNLEIFWFGSVHFGSVEPHWPKSHWDFLGPNWLGSIIGWLEWHALARFQPRFAFGLCVCVCWDCVDFTVVRSAICFVDNIHNSTWNFMIVIDR